MSTLTKSDPFRACPPGAKRGIDLARMMPEVRKLVGKFVSDGHAPDLDRDDLEQEVALAIHRRNECASAFDPSKASFSKYVNIVCRNIAGHMREKSTRREQATEDAALESLVDEQAMEREGAEPRIPDRRTIANFVEYLHGATEEATKRAAAIRRRKWDDGEAFYFDGVAATTKGIAELLGDSFDTSAALATSAEVASMQAYRAGGEAARRASTARKASRSKQPGRVASEGHRLLAAALGSRAEPAACAEACGVTRVTVSHWKNAHGRPRERACQILLSRYGIPIEAWDQTSQGAVPWPFKDAPNEWPEMLHLMRSALDRGRSREEILAAIEGALAPAPRTPAAEPAPEAPGPASDVDMEAVRATLARALDRCLRERARAPWIWRRFLTIGPGSFPSLRLFGISMPPC